MLYEVLGNAVCAAHFYGNFSALWYFFMDGKIIKAGNMDGKIKSGEKYGWKDDINGIYGWIY